MEPAPAPVNKTYLPLKVTPLTAACSKPSKNGRRWDGLGSWVGNSRSSGQRSSFLDGIGVQGVFVGTSNGGRLVDFNFLGGFQELDQFTVDLVQFNLGTSVQFSLLGKSLVSLGQVFSDGWLGNLGQVGTLRHFQDVLLQLSDVFSWFFRVLNVTLVVDNSLWTLWVGDVLVNWVQVQDLLTVLNQLVTQFLGQSIVLTLGFVSVVDVIFHEFDQGGVGSVHDVDGFRDQLSILLSLVNSSKAAASIVAPPAAAPAAAAPAAAAEAKLTPATEAYFWAQASKKALASFSEPKRAAGSSIKAINKVEDCLPAPKPHLPCKYFLAEATEKPPGILEAINLAIKEEDCLPNSPEKVSWN
ncbi:hypothetical protein WICPIJ_009266 [Wickerhamomyces pijperi]|uniref:Uncharacterized protein n=1 Tax=Wickerhamomyces pijperi TaxID=599730 RepID=A0A9P8TDS8_WICPI|nr:hypothetical protein WICPIJ_009266 [Wickerhamomyces pijperi]